MLNVLIIGETDEKIHALGQLLESVGHQVEFFRNRNITQLDSFIQLMQPHLVLIDYSDPLRDSLEHLCFQSHALPSPMLVMSSGVDDALSGKLREAGLAVYTDSVASSESLLKLLPVIDALLMREKKLKEEIALLKQELNDRRDIELAKEYLAEYFGISLNEAYKKMRTQSMQQRRPLGELARAIIDLKHNRPA